MDRREALKATTLFLGYTLTASTAAALIGGCKADPSPAWLGSSLNTQEIDLLAEVCETILPKTDTPGAKDALCHRYIDDMLTHFYTEEERNSFKERLTQFDEFAKSKYTKAFVALTPTEKEEVVGLLATQAKTIKEDQKAHIFKEIKDATVSGYFSSEVGAKGGLCAYLPLPGPYQGCIEYASVGKTYVY